MAPLPKRKLSKQRGRQRQEGQRRFSRLVSSLNPCPNCKRIIASHRVCGYCGFYKGKKIISVSSK